MHFFVGNGSKFVIIRVKIGNINSLLYDYNGVKYNEYNYRWNRVE